MVSNQSTTVGDLNLFALAVKGSNGDRASVEVFKRAEVYGDGRRPVRALAPAKRLYAAGFAK